MINSIIGSVAVKKKMEKLFMEKQKIIKFKLDRARKVCVCIDAWSTKGTCASFFGISACFYDNTTRKSVHVILNFKEMIYPQTGYKIIFKLLLTFTKIISCTQFLYSCKMVHHKFMFCAFNLFHL